MRLVFLDLDGVLNSKTDADIYKKEHDIPENVPLEPERLEHRCLALLKEIVEETDSKVVISSSWRLSWDEKGQRRVTLSSQIMKHVQKTLNEYGIEIVGVTPYVESKDGLHDKGIEIKEYLKGCPNVTNFVILDDEEIKGKLKKYQVLTTYKNGLTKDLKDKAICILLGKVC